MNIWNNSKKQGKLQLRRKIISKFAFFYSRLFHLVTFTFFRILAKCDQNFGIENETFFNNFTKFLAHQLNRIILKRFDCISKQPTKNLLNDEIF